MKLILFVLITSSFLRCSVKETSASDLERKNREDEKAVCTYDISKQSSRRPTYQEIIAEEKERKERLRRERIAREDEEAKREIARLVVGAISRFFDV